MDFLRPLITPYVTIFGNPLMLIFTALSVIQLWRGLQIVVPALRDWANYTANPLTERKKSISDALSFYLFVPIGVFIHEMGHAIFVWLFGGRVVEFGYFFFWGYVLPSQRFGRVEEWVLSSGGTWGNLLLGLGVWLLWRNDASLVKRFLAKRTLRYQIYFALIYYPAFTLFTQFGDWRQIYDFQSTPLLSGATAVVHAAILLGFWFLERRNWFDELAFSSPSAAQKFAALRATLDNAPSSPQAQRDLFAFLYEQGQLDELRGQTAKQLAETPNSAEAHLFRALSLGAERSKLRGAAKSAEKALSLDLHEALDRLTARQIVADYQLAIEKAEEALVWLEGGQPDFNQLLPSQQALQHRYLYAISQAQEQLRQFGVAKSNLARARQLAEWANQTSAVAYYDAQLLRLDGM